MSKCKLSLGEQLSLQLAIEERMERYFHVIKNSPYDESYNYFFCEFNNLYQVRKKLINEGFLFKPNLDFETMYSIVNEKYIKEKLTC